MLYYITLVNFKSVLKVLDDDTFSQHLFEMLKSYGYDVWLIREKGSSQSRHFHGFLQGPDSGKFLDKFRDDMAKHCTAFIKIPKFTNLFKNIEHSHRLYYLYCMKDFNWNNQEQLEITTSATLQNRIHHNANTHWDPMICS